MCIQFIRKSGDALLRPASRGDGEEILMGVSGKKKGERSGFCPRFKHTANKAPKHAARGRRETEKEVEGYEMCMQRAFDVKCKEAPKAIIFYRLLDIIGKVKFISRMTLSWQFIFGSFTSNL